MNALVPGCPIRHPRWVNVTAAVACAVALIVALVWPAWWSVLLVAAVFYLAAYHPACRFANTHFDREEHG